jgi:BON domain-containing protein
MASLLLMVTVVLDLAKSTELDPAAWNGRERKEDTMDRHLGIAFIGLATIAILSGGCSEAERQLAARIASETEGVQDVVNHLEVRG